MVFYINDPSPLWSGHFLIIVGPSLATLIPVARDGLEVGADRREDRMEGSFVGDNPAIISVLVKTTESQTHCRLSPPLELGMKYVDPPGPKDCDTIRSRSFGLSSISSASAPTPLREK